MIRICRTHSNWNRTFPNLDDRPQSLYRNHISFFEHGWMCVDGCEFGRHTQLERPPQTGFPDAARAGREGERERATKTVGEI